MEFYDGIASYGAEETGEQLSTMIDSHLQVMRSDDEDALDVGLLEKLIFPDVERSYSELNKRATTQLVKAYAKIETGKVNR
jgi:hypothetical protein